MTGPIELDPDDWRRYRNALEPDAQAEADAQVNRVAAEADQILRELGAQGPFGADRRRLTGISRLVIHDEGRVEIVLFHRNADGHYYEDPTDPTGVGRVRLWIQDIRLPPHVVEAIARKLEQ